jgi:hypothetical protein
MVAKISVGKSLYGALAYNGEKINGAKGRLLTTNRIYNDGTGTVDIRKAMEGFLACMPEHTRVEKPVLHISLNPHPDDGTGENKRAVPVLDDGGRQGEERALRPV